MKIKKHRLYKDDQNVVPFIPSPNSKGSIVNHEYLVIHFTAGASAQSSIDWLSDKRAKASAHLVIARDGIITQLVPFDKKAWHAGKSNWGNRSGLNSYSLGIELDNAGKLHRQGDKWITWFGTVIAEEDVLVATHKHEDMPTGWHAYTESQIDAVLNVALLLFKKYQLRDVIGHDDIAPERKTDPGPAFPMESIRARVIGRSEEEERVFKTTANLNIRFGPGIEYDKLLESPLKKGINVNILKDFGNWRFVDVLDDLESGSGVQGWVHGRYLSEA